LVTRSTKLNEKDTFFEENRYEMFTTAYQNLQEKLDSFKQGMWGQWEASQRDPNKKLTDSQYRQFMKKYPELSAQKKMFEQHLPIFEKIFANAEKLRDIINLEFGVATGYEDDLNKVKKPQAIPRIAKMVSGNIHNLERIEKIRLLYILFCCHGFLSDPELKTLFDQAGLSQAAASEMKQLSKVGVNAQNGIEMQRQEFAVAKKKTTKDAIKAGDNEHYSPLIRFFVEQESKELKHRGVMKQMLESMQIEWDVMRKMDPDADSTADAKVRLANYEQMWLMAEPDANPKTIKKSFKALATNGNFITYDKFQETMLAEIEKFSGKHIPIGTVTRSQENKKKKPRRWGRSKTKETKTPADDTPAPWILFFVGGVAYNEIREIRRFSQRTGKPIYIGATELLTAKSYIHKFTTPRGSFAV